MEPTIEHTTFFNISRDAAIIRLPSPVDQISSNLLTVQYLIIDCKYINFVSIKNKKNNIYVQIGNGRFVSDKRINQLTVSRIRGDYSRYNKL